MCASSQELLRYVSVGRMNKVIPEHNLETNQFLSHAHFAEILKFPLLKVHLKATF